MSNPYSRAFRMVDDFDCSRCGEQPGRGEPRLRSSSKEGIIFEAEYVCDCGLTYSIEIEEDEKGMQAEIERADTGDVRRIVTADSKLYQESHPARDQMEALFDLVDALDMLKVNWSRVKYLSENQPDYPGDIPLWNDRRFGAQVFTEIHNYLASAYTFQETFDTVIQTLPSGEIVDSKFQEFKEQTQVVIGLRTYVQHEQMFEVRHPPDLDADEYRIDFRVELDEVWTMESQICEDNPNQPVIEVFTQYSHSHYLFRELQS